MSELVLVADNADTASLGGGASGASAASLAGTTVQIGKTGGLVFNITYDSSVSGAPAAFTTAIADVVDYYTSQFTDPVTVNLNIGWGEVNGQSLGPGALGESEAFLYQFSYSQLRAGLAGDAKGSTDTAAVASLPAGDPTGGGTFLTTTAEAKALGLASNSGPDGYVGFASNVTYTFDPNNRAVPGAYDFIGVAEHEISEVMGRIALLGSSVGGLSNPYTPLDLFRYRAAGQRQLSAGQTAYFSVDGGTTNLDNFNTNASGDAGDWAASAGNDSYDAFSGAGTANTVSAADLKVLDAIGWDSASPPSLSADGTTLLPNSGGNLVTSAGTWTFGAPAKSNGNYPILLNGQTEPGGAVELEVANSGHLYANNAQGSWYEWVNSTWTASSNPSPSNPSNPALSISADGATLLPGGNGNLVTSAGTWTFGSPAKSNGNYPVLLNGQAEPGGAVELEVANSGNLYADNAQGNWYEWVNSTWAASSNPSPSNPSNPAPSISPDGTTLLPGGNGSLVTGAGTWTFGAPAKSNGNYPVLLNGQTEPGGAVELEVANSGNLYADNAQGSWYQWTGSGWLATSNPGLSISPDGSTLLPGSGGNLVTSAGTWTFGSPAKSNGNYPILLNGQTEPGGAVELEVANSGQLYADNAQGSWYEWNGSGWIAATNPSAAMGLSHSDQPPLATPPGFGWG